MKNKPIYVELDIDATIEELWEHTQLPQLHNQWDLRFSKIQYLPMSSESEGQKFLYETRIGFGLKISGTGETSNTFDYQKAERLSTLSFASDRPISLIRHGGGYWRYKENGDKLTFITLYDYKTRYGFAGRMLDRFVFRPLFGYATAWSFDRLRIWLEDRIPPSVIAERALIHYVSVIFVMLLWCYEGLVPKLLFPESGELHMLKQIGWFEGLELQTVQLIGILEIGFGVIAAFLHRKNWILRVQLFALFALTAPAILFVPELLRSPFNPVTLVLPMIGLCLTAHWSRRHLPQASRCKRKYKPSHIAKGDSQ